MRLSVQLLPLLLLALLPIYAALSGWGLLKVLLVLTAVLVLREALLLRCIFAKAELLRRQEESGEDGMVLETMPASHYAEKVRWCMDYVGQPYEEEQDIGILGGWTRFGEINGARVIGTGRNTTKVPNYPSLQFWLYVVRTLFLRKSTLIYQSSLFHCATTVYANPPKQVALSLAALCPCSRSRPRTST